MLDRSERTVRLGMSQDIPISQADRSRAYREADVIEMYWIAHGYYGIKTEVIYTPHGSKHAPTWGVRSNIGPTGYPPRR